MFVSSSWVVFVFFLFGIEDSFLGLIWVGEGWLSFIRSIGVFCLGNSSREKLKD